GACALRERHRGVGRVGGAVLREVDGADEVGGVHERPQLLHALGRHRLGRHAEGARHGGAAAQLVPALLVGGDGKAAVLLVAGGLAGLALQGLVEVDGGFVELGGGGGVGHGPHQAGGVPGGAAGELLALEQQHVLPAELGQVIGERAADDAAADDDDLGVGGELGHAGFYARAGVAVRPTLLWRSGRDNGGRRRK